MAGPEKKNKRKKQGTLRTTMLAMAGLATALVFMPSTVMLFFAMLPTVAAGLSDRIRGETRALTVGAMNLAGTTPYLMKLWTTGHELGNAFAIITDPRTIIVVYTAAAMGWLIDWAMSGIVATMMQQGAVARLKAIKERQAELVRRWGREVTGDYILDSYGFPIDGAESRAGEDDDDKAENHAGTGAAS